MKRVWAAVPFAGIAAAAVAWWWFAWQPAQVAEGVAEEPLVQAAMQRVAQVMKDPSAKFRDVEYFQDADAACGEVRAKDNAGNYGDYMFFVAYRTGYVRLSRDMPPGNFLALVEQSCPEDRFVLRARNLLVVTH
jgi:hypothetical protein